MVDVSVWCCMWREFFVLLYFIRRMGGYVGWVEEVRYEKEGVWFGE